MPQTSLTKLSIASLDDTSLQVEAQFNPKELSIDKSVAWSKHANSKGDSPELEFTGADGRSLSFELMFDGYETNTNVETSFVDKLLTMAKARDHKSRDEAMRRPHKVAVRWGIRQFEGVIESMSTKYTMFAPDGVPLRCTVNLKFKEAESLKVKSGGS